MKKSLLFLLALLATNILMAQVPQGFNYQAVARDTEGNTLPSTSLEVRIGILNNTDLVWQEDHSVVTSELGLFSLVIGDESATKSGGSASTFDKIAWAQTAYMLEISIDAGTGFTSMGVTPFMSVPYAMYAQHGPLGTPGEWDLNSDTLYTSSSVGIGTSTPNESLLSIQSNDAQVEKPLFEVKNEMGNPVFAVFNDGVMVYVDEDKKGVKGGFAVGGYNKSSKGVTQEYLRITPDSVRIWVPEATPAKGVKGGFAVGGYNKGTKAITNNFLEVSSANTNIFFDTTTRAKGFKGGFAVGGYNKDKKGESQQLMSLTRDNYLIGQNAGFNITEGRNNTFFGWEAGYLTTIGINNIFLGKEAGYSNDNGHYNIFMGYRSGASHSTGISNIYIGDEAGSENDSSSNQVFIGDWAGAFASAGDNNIFIGGQAGIFADVTDYNTFIGSYSGSDALGERNTYLGAYAGNNVDGDNNVLLGISAGYGDDDAGSVFDNNTYVGAYSGFSTTSGSSNVYLGYAAGHSNDIGSRNVFLGNNAGYFETESDKLYIANSSTESPLIYGDFSTSSFKVNGNAGINYTPFEGYGLIVDVPEGQTNDFGIYSFGDIYSAGVVYWASDLAYKKNIVKVSNALSKIKQVNGVYFDYTGSKSTNNGEVKKSIGVIAQDVEKVFPELVKENMDGLKAVNYGGLIPVLIEAIKDQQSQIEAQQAAINSQQDEIDALKEMINNL